MKISIITATFNSARTIGDTLDSIRAQGYPELEHIVMDGGSTDDTLRIVRASALPGIVVSEPDKGIYDAMNKGIGKATGEVIGILNSDDFYAGPHVLEHVAETFRTTACDALYGDLHYVDAERTERVLRNWVSGAYRPGAFLQGWMPPHPTFFVRKEVYDRLGSFNLSLKSAADYELMLRFIHKHGIRLGYIPEVLVKMRVGGQSNKSLKNRWLANREDRKAWDINELRPKWYTFYMKPARKLIQFLPFLR